MQSQLLGVTSDPSHLDILLDLGIDCGRGYFSSFIFAIERGCARDFVRAQLLGLTSDPSNLDFLL